MKPFFEQLVDKYVNYERDGFHVDPINEWYTEDLKFLIQLIESELLQRKQ